MIYDNHDHDHRNGTFCESEVSIGSYLGARLKSIGVSHFFMVPGDYTLNLLDEMLNIQGLTAVPCCNELNAGYAADGFARCSGKMGVLVGELSEPSFFQRCQFGYHLLSDIYGWSFVLYQCSSWSICREPPIVNCSWMSKLT